jgi:hypothetical protein
MLVQFARGLGSRFFFFFKIYSVSFSTTCTVCKGDKFRERTIPTEPPLNEYNGKIWKLGQQRKGIKLQLPGAGFPASIRDEITTFLPWDKYTANQPPFHTYIHAIHVCYRYITCSEGSSPVGILSEWPLRGADVESNRCKRAITSERGKYFKD